MPFRLLNKEVSKHHKLNGGNHKHKSLNINYCCGQSLILDMVTAHWCSTLSAQRWSSVLFTVQKW